MGQMIQEIVEVIKKTDTEPIVRAWIGKLFGVNCAFWMPVLVVFLASLVYLLFCLFACLSVCLLVVFWCCFALAWGGYCFVDVVDVIEGVWAGPIVEMSSFFCVC